MRIKYGGQVVAARRAYDQKWGDAYADALNLSKQVKRHVDDVDDIDAQVWAQLSCDKCRWSDVIDPCMSSGEAQAVACPVCSGAEVLQ